MIILAADHAGWGHKEQLKQFLKEKGYSYKDMSHKQYTKGDDYPVIIAPAAKEVAKNPGSVGIILGGSGQGEAMAANKIKGIRAAVVYSPNKEIVALSKEHNDANILSIGARFVTIDQMKNIVSEWLATKFSEEERHKRRIQELEKLLDV